MNGSVGLGGVNVKSDVVLVQTLLNSIPPRDAGPVARLVVDGIVGPLTIGAIQRYQKAKTKVVDGRVDVGGPTIKALSSHPNRSECTAACAEFWFSKARNCSRPEASGADPGG